MSTGPEGIPDEVRAWMEGIVRERGPVPKTDQMFRHGREYHECALRCLELRDGHGFLFQPSLVLLAFVVEIYLKGLLAIEGKDPRAGGHDLGKIYGRLEDETQAKVAERYRLRHHGQDLLGDLPAYSKLFVKVRYAYELEGAHEADISGVAQLASSLYETWAELQPGLIQGGLVHDRITAPNQGTPIFNGNECA
ncbi:hypothetical protein DAH55_10935 [Sphingomonas koreensis]|uniref:hypothetical protein n=1 Tax=Sphingomonas koreensis TaxID=93064 RepID=UPI00082953DE|nr:hypothetical protein [Sphingomonas koreensis]RSU59606.1 hypothetical protein DAH56_11560 [Sphingomonas koreensis]RSU68760.1 hypothetical protein DAH55_10935 [Sphingomonas koreensis]